MGSEGIRDIEIKAWPCRFHPSFEVGAIGLHKLALANRRKWRSCLTGEICQDTHDEWQLNSFLRAGELDVVLNLNAWSPFSSNEFRASGFLHSLAPVGDAKSTCPSVLQSTPSRRAPE